MRICGILWYEYMIGGLFVVQSIRSMCVCHQGHDRGSQSYVRRNSDGGVRRRIDWSQKQKLDRREASLGKTPDMELTRRLTRMAAAPSQMPGENSVLTLNSGVDKPQVLERFSVPYPHLTCI